MGEVNATALRSPAWHAAGWVLGAASVLAALSISACAPRQTPIATTTTPAQPTLRVGIAPNYPPLAFKQNGHITGVEAQFAKLLGPALAMHTVLVETPWDDLIPALRDRRIDIIMSGMSVTEQRQQLVSFAHPYLRVGQMMLLRRADAKRLRDDKAINQQTTRIGFVTGTTGEQYVRQHFQRAQLKGFESVDAAVVALRARQIDVFVHDAPSIYGVMAGTDKPERELIGRYEPLTEEYLAWAVRKDDEALRARLDGILAKWNADGTLDSVLSKWIKVQRKPAQTK